jgi:hypothetical protein
MKRSVFLLALCAALSCLTNPGLASPAPRAESAQPVKKTTTVVSAQFGLFHKADQGRRTFEETTTFPLTPNEAFGWMIEVQTDKPKVKWREELTLPAKPATWGDPADYLTISKDGRTATVVKEGELKDGRISNSWEMAPGDPRGKHRIRVWVEEELAGTFEFEVQ